MIMNEDLIKEEIIKFFDLEEDDRDNIEIGYVDRGWVEASFGGMEIVIFDDYDRAEEYAVKYLEEEEYLWRESVQNGNTTSGLHEWAEEVIQMDGAEWQFATYDGNSHEGKEGYIYMRRN